MPVILSISHFVSKASVKGNEKSTGPIPIPITNMAAFLIDQIPLPHCTPSKTQPNSQSLPLY